MGKNLKGQVMASKNSRVAQIVPKTIRLRYIAYQKFTKPNQAKRFNKQKPKFAANKKFRRNKTDAKSLDDQLNNYWGDDKKVRKLVTQ
jgi:hypothetical protein